MIKSSRNIFGTIELENFNYIETKKNVEQLFSKKFQNKGRNYRKEI